LKEKRQRETISTIGRYRLNMDVIIVCHTEFGFVRNREVIADKNATMGVEEGVKNLANLADKYDAKVTFALCPEVAGCFPRNLKHQIGLHIHPGWHESEIQGVKYHVGDLYLKEHCKQSVNSTALKDYPYEEQLEMIKTGKDYLRQICQVESKVFVAGKWSINNDTVKALEEAGITHECSATARLKTDHYDWSRLPRICMPYHPSEKDYQKRGSLSLLIIPISQIFRAGNVNPEVAPIVGLPWLKACFTEYYCQNLPLFHVCLHSPCMTDPYFIAAMDELLKFISKHKGIDFKFASEIEEYDTVIPKTNILPYLSAVNRSIIGTFFKSRILREQ